MAIITNKKKVTPTTLKKVVYSDFYSNLSVEVVKKDLLVYENEESIKRSVRNIILTNKGERFFNPLLGSDVSRMLFENFTPAFVDVFKDMIKVAIKNNEPRAEIISIDIEHEPDNNTVYANILFNVINKTEPVSLELILNRIR